VERYGGIHASSDIAFDFAFWVDSEFKLQLTKEFKIFKKEQWSIQRIIVKRNYRIHTDSIKEQLIPPELTQEQISKVYANEADLLNVALFGVTASQWSKANPDQVGNMRDTASTEQLIVLSNLEAINADFIDQKISMRDRLLRLHAIAIKQMQTLAKYPSSKQISK
jgi:hypothetical protein